MTDIARQPKGSPDSTGGQFAPGPRDEAIVALECSSTQRGGPAITVELTPLTLEVVSPELLPVTNPSMLVQQHNPQVWAWANAAHENYWDKADAMKSRGVTMAARAGDLVPGDKISLGPLLRQLSQDERYTIELEDAKTTMAVVDKVKHHHFRHSAESAAWISTDQGPFMLAFDEPVSFLPGRANRCDQCGGDLSDGKGYAGQCGACADRAENDS